MIIEELKRELARVKDELYYMEETDTAWSREYTILCRKGRVLKNTIKKLERLEGLMKEATKCFTAMIPPAMLLFTKHGCKRR